MSRFACRLIAHSISPHVQQLYTGFRMLEHRGLITLSQEVRKLPANDPTRPSHLQNARHAHLQVVVNDRVTVHYDAHDSWEVDPEFLTQSDAYFKRSYSSKRLIDLGESGKRVRPLGLYYLVYPDTLDRFALQRNFALGRWKRKALAILESLPVSDAVRFTPRVRTMESLPDYDAAPRVLFMVRAWDPDGQRDDHGAKAEERRQINETRAECVRVLRDAFGEDFYGGFIHTDYALRHYRDVLLPDPEQAEKRTYLAHVRRHPICVATTGLHGSIGGKFGEYVAFSKAIVTEELEYEVPGDLGAGTHYLPFRTPQECVEQVHRLRADQPLRAALMANNARYYQSHLRPDALVLQTLLTAAALPA